MDLLIEALTTRSMWPREAFIGTLRTDGRPFAYLCLTPHARLAGTEAELLGPQGRLIDPEAFRAEAAERLKTDYPDFMLRFAVESGLADLYRWQGSISWWWFTGFSENGELRVPMIPQLYWLLVIAAVLRTHPATRICFATDDPALAESLRELVRSRGLEVDEFQVAPDGPPIRPLSWRTLLSCRLRHGAVQWVNWLILRAVGLRRTARELAAHPAERVIFYSRFPVLWQLGERWRAHTYGRLPESVKVRGYAIVHASVLSLGPRGLLQELRRVRQTRAHGVVLLESLWSLQDALRVALTVGPVKRYFTWREQQAQRPIRFHGIDLRPMLLRDLDREMVSGEFAMDLGIVLGMRRLVRELGKIRCVFHTFEHQPMERALWFGVKAARSHLPIVGLQASIFTSNHLGWLFPSPEARERLVTHERISSYPLPDVLATYGANAQEAWRVRMDPQQVVLVGPVRYPDLRLDGAAPDAGAAFAQRHGLQADAEYVLVAGTSVREETHTLLEEALHLAREDPRVFLLIKFHYHCRLTKELEAMARQAGVSRYRVFDSDVHELIRASCAVLTGVSSTSFEAIVLDTMPLVYLSPGSFGPNRMLDIPEAFFFWTRYDQLLAAFRECLSKGPEYQRRTRHWPNAIEQMFYRLDGQADARLCKFLQARQIV